MSAREGVARLIRSAGLMTRTFASGEEFLAAARPNLPSCLVLDVNLPGLNGLDLQQELAKSRPQVPIIFLTGHGDIPMTRPGGQGRRSKLPDETGSTMKPCWMPSGTASTPGWATRSGPMSTLET